MLVLSRKIGEEIVVGDDIRIIVMAVHGEHVRIGISAPRDVVVDRREVREKRKNGFDEPFPYSSPHRLSDEMPVVV